MSLWPLASSDTTNLMCVALATGLLGLLLSVVFTSYPFPQVQWYFQTSEALEGWMQAQSEDGGGHCPSWHGSSAAPFGDFWCHVPSRPPPLPDLDSFSEIVVSPVMN